MKRALTKCPEFVDQYINIQRIKPGHPEQNGRHERMHLTLKNEATRPAAFNFLQQQERFDALSGFTTMSDRTRH